MDRPPREGQPEHFANSAGGEPRAESKDDPTSEFPSASSASDISSFNTGAGAGGNQHQSAGAGQGQNNLLELAGTSLSDFHNPLHPLRQIQQAQAQAHSRNNQGRMAPPALDLAVNFGAGGAAVDRFLLTRNLQIQQLLNPHQGAAGAAANRNQGNSFANAGLLSGRPDFTMQLLMASGQSVPPSLFSQSLFRNLADQQQQQQLNHMSQFQPGSAAAATQQGHQVQGLNASELLRLSQMGTASLSSLTAAQSNQIRQSGGNNTVREEMIREMLLPAMGNNASAGWAAPSSLSFQFQGLAGLAASAGRDLTGVASLSASGGTNQPAEATEVNANAESKTESDGPTTAAAYVSNRTSGASSDPSADPSENSKSARKRKAVPSPQPAKRRKRRVRDPVVVEGVPHHSERQFVSLGIDEDPNWLSEFQCFVRTELMEVIQASQSDVLVRSTSKSILPNQVGVRCRYCAHLAPGSRVCRSSAFPSSLDKLYQSFSMMVRDHFGKCPAVPPEKAQEFQSLKQKNAQGATDSKQYWVYASQKLGMVDAETGIERTETSMTRAEQMPPYGGRVQEDDQEEVPSFVGPEDESQLTPFLYDLMRHLQLVRLLPSERVGKRKGLPVGLEGLGCKYCCREGRLGFSRCFPLRRRALPSHVLDLYRHCLRCPLCPAEIKEQLEQSHQRDLEANNAEPSSSVDSYAIIWTKLGRQRDLTTS